MSSIIYPTLYRKVEETMNNGTWMVLAEHGNGISYYFPCVMEYYLTLDPENFEVMNTGLTRKEAYALTKVYNDELTTMINEGTMV